MPFNPPIPDPRPRGKRSTLFDAFIQAEKLMQVALVLPCAAFIGWLAGDWLAGRLHQPWVAAAGIVFGGAAGLVYVVRLAMDAVKKSASDDAGAGGRPRNKGGSAGRGKGSGGGPE